MNLGELRTAFRNDVDDTEAPYLWSDSDFERYLNDAEREAARRARLLIDSDTSATSSISVLSGTSSYALDSRVIFIRRAKLSSRTKPLTMANQRDMDEQIPGWESSTGTPTHYITDRRTGYISLYPSPTANATLSLTVVRLPLVDMASDADVPEINARYHESLLHWVKYKAYLKKDPETLNEQEAKKHLDLFEQEFGQKSSAIEEEWIERQQQSDPYDGTF